MASKRNTHGWTVRTEDGEKREVRASLFGKRWTFESKLRSEDEWTTHEVPELADLEALYEVLARKYARKHLAWDTMESVAKLVRERGGSLE